MQQFDPNLAAEDIADNLLYRTGLALSHGQLDDVPDCFILPQSMETLEGVRIVREPEDVRQVFASVRRYFEQNGIKDVARAVVEAEFLSGDVIQSTHASRLLKQDGTTVRAPYPVLSRIKRCDDGQWRIASSTYAIIDSREHNEALLTWHSKDRS